MPPKKKKGKGKKKKKKDGMTCINFCSEFLAMNFDTSSR